VGIDVYLYVNGLRKLWCEGDMLFDWVMCCSGQSEGEQVGRGSPPWYLLSDRLSERSNAVLSVACRRSAVFLRCSCVLRVADPTDHRLPTCECIWL
jgi:hypothetical protein